MSINLPAPSGLLARAEAAFFSGRLEEAKGLFLRGVCFDPALPSLVNNAGIVLANLQDWVAACWHFERVVLLDPKSSQGFLELGKALCLREHYSAARHALGASLALEPGSSDSLVHLARAYRQSRGFERAAEVARRARTIDPLGSHALLETGHCERELRHFEASIDALGRASALDPSQSGTLLTAAYCELHVGNYSRGWRLYEYRWIDKEFLKYHRDSPLQRWKGQVSIKGRKLIVFSEQGFGDTIQFARFLPTLSIYEAEVTLLVPPELERLFAGFPGVARITARVPAELFAACCSLMSLPFVTGNTLRSIPFSNTPYIVAPPELVDSWRGRLGKPARPRIGICWSTSENPMSSNRSIRLSEFSALIRSEMEFISLQKTIGSEDITCFEDLQGSVAEFGSEFVDFAMTAGLVELMDLVITVDTAIAHLAGAMGKEVWVLVPERADWRWLTDRVDSPWYPNVRLFRQRAEGDWRGLIGEVSDAITERFGRAEVTVGDPSARNTGITP